MFRRRKGPRDAVAARARVVAMAPTAAAARRPDKLDVEFELRLAIEGRGEPNEVDIVQTVPHEKMIAVGHVVPVRVSASDRDAVTIDFDEVPDAADQARAAAEAAQSGDAGAVAKALGFELADPPEED